MRRKSRRGKGRRRKSDAELQGASRFLSGNGEAPVQHVATKAKDSFHIASHQQWVCKPIERCRVLHMIAYQGAALAFCKSVLMNPKLVGTANLFVDEARWRIPDGDLGAPAQGETVNAQLVIDHRTGMHLNRARLDGVEMQPRRRNRFEILWIRKKRENFLAGLRQPKLRFEIPHPHELLDRYFQNPLSEPVRPRSL